MNGNYYKALDWALGNLFDALGNVKLGDFDIYGEVYLRENYEPGEVPVSVLSEAIGFDLARGAGRRRLEQLAEDGLVIIRKTGRYKPSFVSIPEDIDNAEWFKRAGESRSKRKYKPEAPQSQPEAATPQPEPQVVDQAQEIVLERPTELPKQPRDKKDLWRQCLKLAGMPGDIGLDTVLESSHKQEALGGVKALLILSEFWRKAGDVEQADNLWAQGIGIFNTTWPGIRVTVGQAVSSSDIDRMFFGAL